MSVITAIREKIRRKETQERDRELSDYNALVVAVADGQQPSEEDVERLLSGGTAERPTLVCPTNSEHKKVRVVTTVGDMQECVCDDCGAQFQRAYDAAAAQITGRTVEDLERDIGLLKERRQWKEQLDKRPEVLDALQKVKDKRGHLAAKVENAIEERDKLFDDTDREVLSLEQQLLDADRVRTKMIANCRDGKLREQYGQLIRRRQEANRLQGLLKRELWGYSPVGVLADHVFASTGARMLTHQRNVEQWSGKSQAVLRQHNIDLTKLKRIYHDFQEREWNPKVEEHTRLGKELAEIEGTLTELRNSMLALC